MVIELKSGRLKQMLPSRTRAAADRGAQYSRRNVEPASAIFSGEWAGELDPETVLPEVEVVADGRSYTFLHARIRRTWDPAGLIVTFDDEG